MLDRLKPAYDSQADIYAAIATLLQEGVADLGTPSSLMPGLGRFDSRWRPLRVGHNGHGLGRTVPEPPVQDLGLQCGQCHCGLPGSPCRASVGAGLRFESSTNQNPWYQFTVIDRDGYIIQTGTMFDMMVAANDPREVQSTVAIAQVGISTCPSTVQPTAEVPIVTEHEVFSTSWRKRNWLPVMPVRPHVRAWRQRFQSNMDHVGVDAAASAAYIAALSATTDLELIMNEKYVAMYTHVEAWTDWRRTGYPSNFCSCRCEFVGDPTSYALPRRRVPV